MTKFTKGLNLQPHTFKADTHRVIEILTIANQDAFQNWELPELL